MKHPEFRMAHGDPMLLEEVLLRHKRLRLWVMRGDMLTADFVGQATLIAPGVLSTVDTATITGGTGRFANATGSFTGRRTFDLSTGAVTGSFEGAIATADGSTP